MCVAFATGMVKGIFSSGECFHGVHALLLSVSKVYSRDDWRDFREAVNCDIDIVRTSAIYTPCIFPSSPQCYQNFRLYEEVLHFIWIVSFGLFLCQHSPLHGLAFFASFVFYLVVPPFYSFFFKTTSIGLRWD